MIWIAALFLFQLPQLLEPEVDKNPYTSQADLDQGGRLYGGRCAGCHGPTGDGGKGANLAVSMLPRAGNDRSLYRVIRYGLPDTEMPGSLMAPREIWQIAAFVQSLGRLPHEEIHGDAARGRQIVNTKGGCMQCHSIGIEGGRMGPALTDIGARSSPAHLRAKIQDAASAVPDDFRVVEIKTKRGENVSGIRLNVDVWSIQVRDFGDKLHSFWKQDLAELKVDHRTPMPPYRDRLNAQEINDVVAYLAGLRGAQ